MKKSFVAYYHIHFQIHKWVVEARTTVKLLAVRFWCSEEKKIQKSGMHATWVIRLLRIVIVNYVRKLE